METVVALSFVLDKHGPAAVEEALQAIGRARMAKEEMLIKAEEQIEAAVDAAMKDLDFEETVFQRLGDEYETAIEELEATVQRQQAQITQLMQHKENLHGYIKNEEKNLNNAYKEVDQLKHRLLVLKGRQMLKRRR